MLWLSVRASISVYIHTKAQHFVEGIGQLRGVAAANEEANNIINNTPHWIGHGYLSQCG